MRAWSAHCCSLVGWQANLLFAAAVQNQRRMRIKRLHGSMLAAATGAALLRLPATAEVLKARLRAVAFKLNQQQTRWADKIPPMQLPAGTHSEVKGNHSHTTWQQMVQGLFCIPATATVAMAVHDYWQLVIL